MHLTTTFVAGCLLGRIFASVTESPQWPRPRAIVPKGKKIQWVGHSFHWFLPAPVAQLAKEAGIEGHENIGIDRIGASLPCQHWNKGGESGTNNVKEALRAGKADVLTLATREKAPDECVAKFANLAFEHKKSVNVYVHETWLPQSANPTQEGCQDWGCTNRDIATYEMLEETRAKREQPFRTRLRAQLTELNAAAKTNYTFLIPVWDAVLTMREMVVKGELPGVPKQSNLFQDNLGHAKKPLQDMASYMWFAALYDIDPHGMKALGSGTPDGQAAILQKLAWDTLKKEPLNALKESRGS